MSRNLPFHSFRSLPTALAIVLAALPAACDKAGLADDGSDDDAGGMANASTDPGDEGDTCPDSGDPAEVFVDLSDASDLPLQPSTCTVDTYTFDVDAERSTLTLTCANDVASGTGTVIFGTTGHQALPLAPGDTVEIEVSVGWYGDGEGYEVIDGFALYDPSQSPRHLLAAASYNYEWGGYAIDTAVELFSGVSYGGGATEVCGKRFVDTTDAFDEPCTEVWDRWALEFSLDGDNALLAAGRAAVVGDHLVALGTASTLAETTCVGDYGVGSLSFVVVPAAP